MHFRPNMAWSLFPKIEEKPKLLGRDDYDEVEESDDEEEDIDGNDKKGVDPSVNQPQQQAIANTQQQPPIADNAVLSPPLTETKAPVKKTWATLVNPIAASTIVLTENPQQWGLSFGRARALYGSWSLTWLLNAIGYQS